MFALLDGRAVGWARCSGGLSCVGVDLFSVRRAVLLTTRWPRNTSSNSCSMFMPSVGALLGARESATCRVSVFTSLESVSRITCGRDFLSKERKKRNEWMAFGVFSLTFASVHLVLLLVVVFSLRYPMVWPDSTRHRTAIDRVPDWMAFFDWQCSHSMHEVDLRWISSRLCSRRVHLTKVIIASIDQKQDESFTLRRWSLLRFTCSVRWLFTLQRTCSWIGTLAFEVPGIPVDLRRTGFAVIVARFSRFQSRGVNWDRGEILTDRRCTSYG